MGDAPGFGDRVRIRRTEVTEAAGPAGLEGTIFGTSVPSSSGVDVVGPAPGDFVVNVFVDARDADCWLAPEHVEVLDAGAGQEIRIDGADKRWVRRADGGWDEIAG